MKYQKKGESPGYLEKILLTANLLPGDLDGLRQFESQLNSVKEEFKPVWAKFIERNRNDYLFEPEMTSELKDIQSKFIAKLQTVVSPELAEQIDLNLQSQAFQRAAFVLQIFIDNKRILLRVIYSFNAWDKGYKRHVNLWRNFDFGQPMNNFNFNEDTSIRLTDSEVPEILTRNNTPIERLKICPIEVCQKIFWAKKIDSPACSAKCCNTLKARRFRSKERIEYLQSEITAEFEKLNKQIKQFGLENPLVDKQMGLLNKLENKLDRKKFANHTL